jgi:hypothetical protein
MVEATLAPQPWSRRLPVRVSVDDVERGKPAPDGYRLAARLLGVDPTSCLALEDSLVGARAAVAAGAHCILATFGSLDPVEARRVTPFVVTDLSEALARVGAGRFDRVIERGGPAIDADVRLPTRGQVGRLHVEQLGGHRVLPLQVGRVAQLREALVDAAFSRLHRRQARGVLGRLRRRERPHQHVGEVLPHQSAQHPLLAQAHHRQARRGHGRSRSSCNQAGSSGSSWTVRGR